MSYSNPTPPKLGSKGLFGRNVCSNQFVVFEAEGELDKEEM